MAAFDHEYAHTSKLPEHSGDGYGWGGGAVVTIGQHSIMLGEGMQAHLLADEIARRWNAGRLALSPTPQEADHGRE